MTHKNQSHVYDVNEFTHLYVNSVSNGELLLSMCSPSVIQKVDFITMYFSTLLVRGTSHKGVT